MVNTLRTESYREDAYCQMHAMKSMIEGGLPVSAVFHSGNIYGIVCDFGGGAWKYVSALCGNAEGTFGSEGCVYYNGEHVQDSREMQKYACNVSEMFFHQLNDEEREMSVHQWLERSIAQSGSNYSIEEIAAMFDLTPERRHRPIVHIGNEIWRASMAIGFAQGKTIFGFPWCGSVHLWLYDGLRKYCTLLRDAGAIVLIPGSTKQHFRTYCDRIAEFGEGGELHFKKNRFKGFWRYQRSCQQNRRLRKAKKVMGIK